LFFDIKRKDYELAAMADELSLEDGYNSSLLKEYDEYIRLAAPNERAFLTLQVLISVNIATKNFPQALSIVKKYKEFFGNDHKKTNNLINILEAKYDYSIQVNSISYNINTNDGSEYCPIVSADGSKLFFCGKNRSDNYGGEDIFVSEKKNEYWTKAKIVSDLSSANSNDAPLSISVDGTTLLLFKSGYIFSSEKNKYGWSDATKLSETINGNEWQADIMMSSDGKAMLFAAVSDENYNLFTDINSSYHGGYNHQTDIYVSLLNEYDNWSEPINIGNTINTIYSDRSPFLHPDMKTLYFCSDGHGGLGKLDFFKSTRLSDTCWDCWSEPVNMGKEINTEERDWGYQISTDGEVAYFARQDSDDNNNIYYLNIPKHLRPDYVATISGHLVDKYNQPVSADIRWEDLETGKDVGKSKSDPADGSFYIVLPLGRIYGYYVENDEYFPISNNVDLRNNDVAVEIVEDIDMVSFKQMIEDGDAVPVNNLFFNFGQYDLLPYSLPELKRVADIIKSNGLYVEISGHTDNVGTQEDNQELSVERAIAVKDFLISEGCDGSKLSTVGYGDTKPVATNDTDKGRAKNRRVELRFVQGP
jgi:outer membrane protein OmpA-like peptidoglycan-associated protein